MIMPSDIEYHATKQIMLGKAQMKPEFKPLAGWIDKTFSVKTINIIYDTINGPPRPRLNICFEFEKEKRSFDKNNISFDKDKQKQIAAMFKLTMEEQGTKGKYLAENAWVYYSAFEPVAKIEANESIPREKIAGLKQQLNNPDLWEISRCFAAATFFLYTDKQVKKYENSRVRKDWTNRYFDILESYNEFGYFKRDSFFIYLDSKENFDNNYESNWYYYYK